MRSLFKRFDFRVSIVYFITASLWIVLSDNALNAVLSGSPRLLSAFSVLKGWGFVCITTLALFAILRIELRKRDNVETILQQDIIERTKTLEALRHSEARFETIFHGSPVATSISRREDGHIIDANDAFLALFEYTRDEMIGHTSQQLGLWVNPELRDAAVQSIADTGSAHHVELEGLTKTGNLIRVLASTRSIVLGNKPHFVSMFYDVSEQRKLEEQAQYQALLLTNVSDAVLSTDTQFNIQSWNPAAEAIYGWKAAEVIGKPVASVLKGDFLETTEEEALAELQANGHWHGQIVHLRKDGSRIHLFASTSYVYDKRGQHIGVVSVNRDISDLLKAQQERQEAAELRIQIQKQSELVRLKESFISIVSHEFRTPLTVIMASAELILNYAEKMPPERRTNHLTVVLEQARFMTELLEDVLTINKARAGRLDFNPTPIDLAAFIQETLERIRGVDKGIHQFVFAQEGDLSAVPVDVKLLQHILVNLLSNAVKYSPDGGEVRLDVARQNGEIVLKVSDRGIGIPPEYLAHLYEPFLRANNTGKIGGTGLGMAIVKESVDLHKGTIHYESEVGVGTTATVTLPAIINVEPDVSAESSSN
jgi:PAS domain S-box-containing protein